MSLFYEAQHLFTRGYPQAQHFEEDNYAEDSASLPAEHRSSDDYGPNLIPAASDSWPLTQPDMPSITNLQVSCHIISGILRIAVVMAVGFTFKVA